MTRLTLLAALLVLPAVCAADPSPAQVFETRILPIFKSPNPSSCVQCHLAGVDLKDYILPSADQTFRSLRDQGLVDMANPERSKILTLISMGKEDPKAPAVHAKNRKAEYEAFAAWIKACAADPALRDAPTLDAGERARPKAADEVIRHERSDRLLASFERTVWALRFRCMNCHTEGTLQNDKFRKEHGDRVAWVKAAGAEATMNYLIASRLIDRDEPEKSLLLRKPLGELEHGGGKKFLPGDLGYKGFRAWLEDYAATVNDRYVKLVVAHLDTYKALSDDAATGMLKEYLSIERARTDVKSEYVPRFGKVITAKKVARFFQVDNKLDAVINADMARLIPLAR